MCSNSRVTLPVLNPATEEPLAELEQAGVEETDAAVARARAAFPAWRAVAPSDRARLLRRLATVLGGLVVGVLIGYVIGDPRAKLYQRMAEQARLQLQLEQRITQNDARMAQLLTALTARAAAAAQGPAAPQPVPPVMPAQPMPPAQPLQPVPVQQDEPAFELPTPRLRTVIAQQAPTAPPLSPPLSG